VLFITEASGGFKAICLSFKLLNDRGRMGKEKDKDGGWKGLYWEVQVMVRWF